MSYYQEAKSLEEKLITWRRDLHQIPEVGLELPQTVAYVSEQLKEMNIEHTVLSDISCITATLGQGSPCILLRGDMDGLPIEEPAGLEYASTNGCMHGCGHDLHAATMLGVAALLKMHESELHGSVKLLFQSGEEIFAGAQASIQAGILENPKVDAAFAMHAFAEYDCGRILYGMRPMASVYGFKITLHGKGGHGSQPERCIDPINAGVQVYLALQALLARECPPTQEAALTIGQFTAGQAANAIPEEAILQGTLRTFEPEIGRLLSSRIKEIVPAVAAAYRCTCEIETLSDVPCLMCDETFTKQALASAERSGAVEDFQDGLHLIGSEDFARFSEKVPSCYFIMGAGVEDPSKRRGQHNPEILFNEEAIVRNVAVYTQVAMDYLG